MRSMHLLKSVWRASREERDRNSQARSGRIRIEADGLRVREGLGGDWRARRGGNEKNVKKKKKKSRLKVRWPTKSATRTT